jgi:hypothetical protein
MRSRQVQVKDNFRPMSEYCVDPLTIVAIGLKIGEAKMEKARLLAKERGMGEFAAGIGNAGLHVSLRVPPDAWPPEEWMHEFVKPKYLHQARMTALDG